MPSFSLAGRRWTPGESQRAWVIVLVAFGVRVAFVLAFGRTGFTPLDDTLFYHSAASSLADGKGFTYFGHPTAHWPPAYPFLLSLIYRVTGPNPLAGLLLNACFGAAAVGLLFAVARETFGLRAARIAAWGLALMPGQILFSGLVLSESFYAFELIGFVALIVLPPRRHRVVLLAGVAAGVAALSRGEGLAFPLLAFAAWSAIDTPRGALPKAAAVTGLMLVIVVPWTIRNAYAVHAFVPVSTNSSTTLWSGHNPAARGGAVYSFGRPILRQIHLKPGELFEVEEARVLRRAALHYAVSHPARELELIPLKLRALARGDGQVIPLWYNRGKHWVPTGLARVFVPLATAASYALLFLALAGVVFERRLWRLPATRAALAFLALALVLYGFVYYGNFRYRVPLEPLMLLIAAPLLARFRIPARVGRLRGRAGSPTAPA